MLFGLWVIPLFATMILVSGLACNQPLVFRTLLLPVANDLVIARPSSRAHEPVAVLTEERDFYFAHSERHYRIVADYINSTHLGIRLVFHQVPSVHNEARRDLLNDPKRVPARLSYLEESPYTDWLKAEVNR